MYILQFASLQSKVGCALNWSKAKVKETDCEGESLLKLRSAANRNLACMKHILNIITDEWQAFSNP